MMKPEQTENERLTVLTMETIPTHIYRPSALMQRYWTNHPSQVINLDQSGVSFKTASKYRKGKYSASDREKYRRIVLKNIDKVMVISVL